MKEITLNLMIVCFGILICLLAVKTGQYALAVVGGVISSIKITLW